jgi:hypothetical protein
MPVITAVGDDDRDRGGNGRNGDGTWPRTDGRGCPRCGAIWRGFHGGGCPNQIYTYDKDGAVIGRAALRPRPPSPWRPWENT